MKEKMISSKKIISGAIVLLTAVNIVLWSEVMRRANIPDLSVTFFDVGQGDAEFIEAKDGTQILIDGGPNNKILSLLTSRMPWHDRSIDAVIITHPHADHITGLIDVFERYDVDMIFESGASYHTAESIELERLIEAEGAERIVVDGPLAFQFFDGARIQFLSPRESFEGKDIKKIHDAMLVSQLIYQGRKILFMGDAEKNIEHSLGAEGVLNDVDILKVGHHGSKTSTTGNFLRIIQPEYAVISVGKNRYGHPHQDVLSRLNAFHAKILRTDIKGTITLALRRGTMTWQQEK